MDLLPPGTLPFLFGYLACMALRRYVEWKNLRAFRRTLEEHVRVQPCPDRFETPIGTTRCCLPAGHAGHHEGPLGRFTDAGFKPYSTGPADPTA